MRSLKIALFTYSTKPRGGVVHTLNLGENLAKLGHLVHIYALGSNYERSVTSKPVLSSAEGTRDLPYEVKQKIQKTGSPPVLLVDRRPAFFRPVDVPHTLIHCPVVEYKNIDEKIADYIRIYYEFLRSIDQTYDIYHAEDCISANALLELRDNGFIKSFVRTVHHLDDFKSRSLIECQSNSILKPNYVMVVSKYWERQLRSLYSLNTTLTHNGVDVGRFTKTNRHKFSKDLAKTKFSVNGYRVILSIGGIEPRKNTLTTLRAFNIAKSHFMKKDERLVWLIGGGETLFDYRPYRGEFFSQVERLGLKMDQDIRVLGNIPDVNMPDLYGAGDVFVFPSLKEGWGLVVLEAMASGVPVIASDIEPLTEYLKDGENAVLIPPTDHGALARKIIDVLENEDFREKLATNGLKTANSYTWRNTALMHSELYNRILQKKG
jgi:glycosyltransferase-like protein